MSDLRGVHIELLYGTLIQFTIKGLIHPKSSNSFTAPNP